MIKSYDKDMNRINEYFSSIIEDCIMDGAEYYLVDGKLYDKNFEFLGEFENPIIENSTIKERGNYE